ncbi:PspC domain-containing protein [Halothermothrix orenii]|uniref:Phage shock protein C, PspC n=1 Tax=Halothermothrix orenii (strain H 168 / OCM 544 / DSM 9562) TaxID=373903 RepID=B8D0F6_HALOH|nr:PspC domain-containing protein [Halothermothrix orenii]ACL70892.1 phage shock protein C, PspC [Halothermothrix orenii H 168]
MNQKLYRSRRDNIIAGICGGISDYFGIDSTLVRILFLLLIIIGNWRLVVLFYIIGWVIIPLKPSGALDDGVNKGNTSKKGNLNNNNQPARRKLIGYFLIITGCIFLIDIWLPRIYWDYFWPVLIILTGLALVVKGVRESE